MSFDALFFLLIYDNLDRIRERNGELEMFETLKCLINNFNQYKYIKNQQKIEFNKSDKDEERETNLPVIEMGNISRIDELETEIRNLNLTVFASNYFKFRVKRFCYVTLPSMLTLCSVATTLSPSKNKIVTEPVYRVESTIYNSDLGETYIEQEKFVNTMDTVVSIEDGIESKNLSNLNRVIKLKVYDDECSLFANFSVWSDGSISCESRNAGKNYFDFKDYGDYEFKESDYDYAALYDKLSQVLLTTYPANEELLELNDKDEKTVVIEITDFPCVGETDVEFKSVSKIIKVAFSYAALAMTLIIIYFSAKNNSGYKQFKRLECLEDGRLIQVGEKEVSWFFQGLEYRGQFVEAEKNRIIKLWEELGYSWVSAQAILTKYEQAIIKSNEDDVKTLELKKDR